MHSECDHIPDFNSTAFFQLLIIIKGEHGIGLGKKEFMEKEVGEGSLSVMRGIKRSLDPFWLMNPGKVFDP